MHDPILDYLISAINGAPNSADLDAMPQMIAPFIHDLGVLLDTLSHAHLLKPIVCMGVEYGPTFEMIQNAIYGTLQYFGLIASICQ